MTAAVTPPGYCGYCTVPRQGSQQHYKSRALNTGSDLYLEGPSIHTLRTSVQYRLPYRHFQVQCIQ